MNTTKSEEKTAILETTEIEMPRGSCKQKGDLKAVVADRI